MSFKEKLKDAFDLKDASFSKNFLFFGSTVIGIYFAATKIPFFFALVFWAFIIWSFYLIIKTIIKLKTKIETQNLQEKKILSKKTLKETPKFISKGVLTFMKNNRLNITLFPISFFLFGTLAIYHFNLTFLWLHLFGTLVIHQFNLIAFISLILITSFSLYYFFKALKNGKIKMYWKGILLFLFAISSPFLILLFEIFIYPFTRDILKEFIMTGAYSINLAFLFIGFFLPSYVAICNLNINLFLRFLIIFLIMSVITPSLPISGYLISCHFNMGCIK